MSALYFGLLYIGPHYATLEEVFEFIKEHNCTLRNDVTVEKSGQLSKEFFL
jgi:hypothetical protein